MKIPGEAIIRPVHGNYTALCLLTESALLYKNDSTEIPYAAHGPNNDSSEIHYSLVNEGGSLSARFMVFNRP